ncbi:oxysterol-binding protein-related protein 10-like [Dendronephthya gigantea]|uniref:oxysterol-binding protein-related protein 10-like n=1 Tax=Dendronephthya gigantea TaxID=151771 RepID=UPI00106BCFB2|nr:oxysterol-binding protein-related protein 10-like [Dendronephthya gigantea]
MSFEIRLKEGYLTKYRNVWHGWKKYYFKLERSYLHYFETKYTAKPIGTATRGEISQVAFSKDHPLIGFEIHLKSGEIWHLQAANHEERMDWMRTLKPDAIISDPFMASTASQPPIPSAPPQEQNQFPTNYQRIYPRLQNENTNIPVGAGAANLPASIPPPAYDDINYR